MHQLADLLATLPLPDSSRPEDDAPLDPTRVLAGHSQCDAGLVHDLGADLPEGHLHVWGGPAGAGKTAFLLCLLQGAARQGRRVVYATYDLPPESLAMRLLAMTAGVELGALPDPGGNAKDCALEGADLDRAHAARQLLSELPFEILPARGFSAQSLQDRMVRMPYRAGILAVDYLQGVVREPGSEVGMALRELSTLAEQLHVAVVCAVRAGDGTAAELEETGLDAIELDGLRERGISLPDRVGWIAPLEATSPEDCGARRARVIHNRHGQTPAVPLHLDEATGQLGRAEV